MKKIFIMLFIVALCLMLTGCGTKTPNDSDSGNMNNEYTDYEEEKIKEPVVDWWKMYKNTNKTNCVTLQVSNPNNFPIQFSYDLVYYKNNEVVKTENKWAMTGIDALGTGIIYGDIKIPSSSEVDNVKLENIEVSKFEWKTLKSTFKKSFIDNEVQYFDAEFSEKPSHTEIWVVLYSDNNKDKKVQADEFVQMGLLAPFVNILEEKGQIHIPTPSERIMYTDYQIYCFAFKTEN